MSVIHSWAERLVLDGLEADITAQIQRMWGLIGKSNDITICDMMLKIVFHLSLKIKLIFVRDTIPLIRHLNKSKSIIHFLVSKKFYHTFNKVCNCPLLLLKAIPPLISA